MTRADLLAADYFVWYVTLGTGLTSLGEQIRPAGAICSGSRVLCCCF